MIESSLPQSEPVLLPGRPFGRQVRSVVGYSVLTALLIVTETLVFVPAALLYCAIRNGRGAAWAVLASSAVMASLRAAWLPAAAPGTADMAWSYLAAVVLALGLPSMAAVPMVERGEKLGRVLLFVLAGAMVGLALTEIAANLLLSFSPYATMVAQWKGTTAQVVQFYRTNGMPAEGIRSMERWSELGTFIFPAQILIFASVAYSLSLLMVGRLAVWRESLARRGDPVAMGAYLFRNFKLPDWLLFAFLFGGLTPLAGGMLQKVAANTLAVVLFLYFVQGLAIVRSLLVTVGAGLGATLAAWATLVFLLFTGVTQMLLTVAGLFDSFFDFRHFKKRKDDSHESHSD